MSTTLSSILALSSSLLIAPLIQMTHGPMYHFPRWSPDGKTILVSATIDGDSELYVLSADGGVLRRLTDNVAEDDAGLWIDGGHRILFRSDRRGRIEQFVMNADGADQRPTDMELPAAISPDGRTRLSETVVDGRRLLTEVSNNGSRRVITNGPDAEQGSYSPDGHRIVFEQRSAHAPDDIPLSNVVVAQADGSEPRVVASGTDPSWSPDGAMLLFKTFDRTSQQLWIATVRPDGAELRRLAPGVHPHWSPDGRRIAFMQDAHHRTDIWIMDRDGRGLRCLTCPSR
jgi:Tol biopolymer transport system component